MENSKKNLKIYGILFIALGIFDVILLGIDFFQEDLTKMWGIELEGVPSNIINTIIIILFAIMLIEVLIKLFLGIRGIQQSNGKCKGKSHITLAKIILVLIIIVTGFSIFGMKWEKSSLIGLMDDLVTILILFEYVRAGKKLLD